ncbi:MAG: ABC transporter permease [Acidimicrobiia bacterium]|nr:ABC transporter permease [Acidimicrobiia bacterium]
MWKTTVHGLLAHKLRFALTALAVFLGVAFMAGTLVLTDTIGKAFDDLFASVNEGVDAVVREESPFDDDFGQAIRSPIPEQIADELTAVDGVESVEGNVFGAATVIGTPEQIAKREKEGDDALGRNRGAQSPALGFNWPVAQEVNPLRVVAGEAPAADDEIVVDKATADEEDLAVGDDVVVTTVAGTEAYELVGIVTFGTADSPGGSSVTAWETSAAQRALGFDGTYLDVRVIADDGVSQDEVVANISEAIEAGEITGTANGRDLKLEVLTGAELTDEDQNELADQLGFFNTFLLVFAGVALFVGIFIIYNTFSIIVAQRTREMALLRAIGADRRQVLMSVMLEALIVGLLASALGLGAGILLAGVLQGALEALGIDLPSTSTVIGMRTLVASMVVGTLITVVSAWMPARRAAAIPPIAALRDVSIDTSGRSGRRVAIGLAIATFGALGLFVGLFTEIGNSILIVGVGAVLVFLGVIVLGPLLALPMSRALGAPVRRFRGTAGTLAQANAMRNPKRTSATAAALIIGVGLVGFITIFASSASASIGSVIDKAFLADFTVDSGSFGLSGLPPELVDQIEELDGVEAVSPVRLGTAEIEGKGAQLSAVDPTTINQLFDVGVSEGAIEGAGPTDLFVLRDKAEEEGWTVGDTVTVNFARTGEQELAIAAIYDEPQPAGTYTITLEGFEQNFDESQQFDPQVYVRYEEGFDLDQAREELEATVFAVAPNGGGAGPAGNQGLDHHPDQPAPGCGLRPVGPGHHHRTARNRQLAGIVDLRANP